WFARSPFRTRFEAKGRFSDYLADIPTYVITTPNPAFHGVATILAEHLRGRSGANTLMERIGQLREELSPAEARVATLVLEHPRTVLN
ncbi:glucokinase, partial [Acinetobacter baumannii]